MRLRSICGVYVMCLTRTAVLLDECSQIIEPLSLLPMRFACSRLLCVGDPLQLPPTIQHFTEGAMPHRPSVAT